MSSSVQIEALAAKVRVVTDTLRVDLVDGRVIGVPLAWYPRLAQATRKELQNFRLIGKGQGIHWPDLDEDVSLEDVLAGRKSQESRESLRRWLKARQRSAASR